MNTVLDFISNNPFIFMAIISIIALTILFAIGFELPQKTVKLITIFYREQKLFKLFPRAVSIFFERCFPVNQKFVIPEIGDYIRVNKGSYKGYTMLKADTWKHKDLTWEEVKELANNNK